MAKFCSNCGFENKNNAQFCKKCGTPFNSVKSNIVENKKELKTKKNTNVWIIAIAVIICVAIIASAFVLLNGDFLGTNDSPTLENNFTELNNVDSDKTNETKSWKLIDTYTGAGTGVETHNLPEGKLKVKVYAFPLKNYGTNYLHVNIPQGKAISLEWDSHSAVASKSKTTSFDSDGSNAFTIDYEELDDWEVDVYQYS